MHGYNRVPWLILDKEFESENAVHMLKTDINVHVHGRWKFGILYEDRKKYTK